IFTGQTRHELTPPPLKDGVVKVNDQGQCPGCDAERRRDATRV
ncbi:unnamed protein product, partial [Larinioides sclopetarius]